MIKIIVVCVLKLMEISAWMKSYDDAEHDKKGDLCLHFIEGVILTAINLWFVFN